MGDRNTDNANKGLTRIFKYLTLFPSSNKRAVSERSENYHGTMRLNAFNPTNSVDLTGTTESQQTRALSSYMKQSAAADNVLIGLPTPKLPINRAKHPKDVEDVVFLTSKSAIKASGIPQPTKRLTSFRQFLMKKKNPDDPFSPEEPNKPLLLVVLFCSIALGALLALLSFSGFFADGTFFAAPTVSPTLSPTTLEQRIVSICADATPGLSTSFCLQDQKTQVSCGTDGSVASNKSCANQCSCFQFQRVKDDNICNDDPNGVSCTLDN